MFKRELSECKAAAAAETAAEKSVAEETVAEETVSEIASESSSSDSAPCSDNEFEDWYPWKYLVDAEATGARDKHLRSLSLRDGDLNGSYCRWANEQVGRRALAFNADLSIEH